MSFIPEEETRGRLTLNLAPMIDFLFLMLVFFATLAVSRVSTRDTDIQLVELIEESGAVTSNANHEQQIVNISITEKGEYKWVTEIRDYPMKDAMALQEELEMQYESGQLPSDKLQTQVLLKIDRHAQWDPILRAVFAIRAAGFEARPVYEPEEGTS
ncbi:MAG: hypothetical protein CMO81_10965 [Waddliaceae bacterium]|nr:hypothetical protein [Waddliaceae bacterium]